MVTMIAMKDRLKPSRFLFDLEKSFFADYVEMLSWVEKYANAKEAMAFRKETASNRTEKKEKRKREEPSEEIWASRSKKSSNLPPHKF